MVTHYPMFLKRREEKITGTRISETCMQLHAWSRMNGSIQRGSIQRIAQKVIVNSE